MIVDPLMARMMERIEALEARTAALEAKAAAIVPTVPRADPPDFICFYCGHGEHSCCFSYSLYPSGCTCSNPYHKQKSGNCPTCHMAIIRAPGNKIWHLGNGGTNCLQQDKPWWNVTENLVYEK